MKNVNLLGRGPSLKYLNVLPDSELVVLANDFDTEISQIKELSDYLKKQTIHLVLNMVVHNANGYNAINFFTEFNVVKLIRPYLNGIRVPGSSGQSIPLEENFLGDNHKEFMFQGGLKYPYDYAGTGLAAFAYTMLDTNAEVVNVLGLDFYDNLKLLFKNITTFIKKTTDGEKELASTMKESNKTLMDSLDSLKLMLKISDIKNNLNDLIQETENYQPKNSDDMTIFINNDKIKTLQDEYLKKFKEYLILIPEQQRNIIQQLHEGKITQDEFKQYSESLITKKEEYKIDENHQLIIDNFRKTEQTLDDIKNVYEKFIDGIC